MQSIRLGLAFLPPVLHTARAMSNPVLVTADAKKKPWRPCRKAGALGL
jgi:hypothetical protein